MPCGEPVGFLLPPPTFGRWFEVYHLETGSVYGVLTAPAGEELKKEDFCQEMCVCVLVIRACVNFSRAHVEENATKTCNKKDQVTMGSVF